MSGTGCGSSEPEKTYKVGEVVEFEDDSKWVVVEVKDLGGTAKSRHKYTEPATTPGRFVQIRFTVTNLTSKEERILITPKMVDAKGREFGEYDGQLSYLPDGAETMLLKGLPPGIPKECYSLFEVASDAQELKFRARSISSVFPATKLIDLGLAAAKVNGQPGK